MKVPQLLVAAEAGVDKLCCFAVEQPFAQQIAQVVLSGVASMAASSAGEAFMLSPMAMTDNA